ncbi:MAG: hypothetical protein AAF998_01710 [Bacteroidota bacterium]
MSHPDAHDFPRELFGVFSAFFHEYSMEDTSFLENPHLVGFDHENPISSMLRTFCCDLVLSQLAIHPQDDLETLDKLVFIPAVATIHQQQADGRTVRATASLFNLKENHRKREGAITKWEADLFSEAKNLLEVTSNKNLSVLLTDYFMTGDGKQIFNRGHELRDQYKDEFDKEALRQSWQWRLFPFSSNQTRDGMKFMVYIYLRQVYYEALSMQIRGVPDLKPGVKAALGNYIENLFMISLFTRRRNEEERNSRLSDGIKTQLAIERKFSHAFKPIFLSIQNTAKFIEDNAKKGIVPEVISNAQVLQLHGEILHHYSEMRQNARNTHRIQEASNSPHKWVPFEDLVRYMLVKSKFTGGGDHARMSAELLEKARPIALDLNFSTQLPLAIEIYPDLYPNLELGSTEGLEINIPDRNLATSEQIGLCKKEEIEYFFTFLSVIDNFQKYWYNIVGKEESYSWKFLAQKSDKLLEIFLFQSLEIEQYSLIIPPQSKSNSISALLGSNGKVTSAESWQAMPIDEDRIGIYDFSDFLRRKTQSPKGLHVLQSFYRDENILPPNGNSHSGNRRPRRSRRKPRSIRCFHQRITVKNQNPLFRIKQ